MTSTKVPPEKNSLGLFCASFAFGAGATWWIGRKYFAIDRLRAEHGVTSLHASCLWIMSSHFPTGKKKKKRKEIDSRIFRAQQKRASCPPARTHTRTHAHTETRLLTAQLLPYIHSTNGIDKVIITFEWCSFQCGSTFESSLFVTGYTLCIKANRVHTRLSNRPKPTSGWRVAIFVVVILSSVASMFNPKRAI